MIYLDYAANTKPDETVLNDYVDATKTYWANPNSNHPLGKLAAQKIDESSESIASFFNTGKESVIYTSGSSESNNLVIKGIAEQNKKNGHHIIISSIEHSSIVAPCNYLARQGYDISVIPLNSNGEINLDILKKELNDETILVSICTVDSELGTIQPINEIAKILKGYPHCTFHTDATQAIGKVDIDYTGVDFITFAPHKFYGLNGSGILLNLNNKPLVPLIQGGKSTTKFRSGTPVIGNVVATSSALKIAISNLSNRYIYIKKLNDKLRNYFQNSSHIHINSPVKTIPNTLNISLIDIDAKKVVKELSSKEIYVSTTSACSLDNMPSISVYAITGDKNLANNSIRISLSHLTTEKEIDTFIKIFDEIIKNI